MLVFDQLNKGERPLRLLAWCAGAGLLLLLAGLARVQILGRHRFEQSLQTQSYQSVRVPAMRGRILDRNGRELAGNAPRYRLDVYLEELSRDFTKEYARLRKEVLAARGGATVATPGLWERIVAKFRKEKPKTLITGAENEMLWRQARYMVVSNVVAQVAARVGLPLTLTEKELHRHWSNTRALPLAVLKKLTPQQVALLTEQSWAIRGISVELQPVRSYPNGALAAHVLGHLVRADDYTDEDEDAFDYRLRDYKGERGLEAAFDSALRGVAGGKSILVNSAGYRVGETILSPPVAGQNIVTTLDLGLQQAAELALSEVNGDERGAVVVLDIRNGDVLASASAPTYDPGEWIDGISHDRWDNFYSVEPRLPRMNRVTDGAYQPGSIFKIVTALAALENGLNPDAIYMVESSPGAPGKGAYMLGNRRIGDTAPPGPYDFRRAFIRSSNSYFIDQGLKMGWDRLLSTAHRFHFGEQPGVQLPNKEQRIGWMPDGDEARAQRWQLGRLANFSIGQEVTVTPIQMAVMVATIANGGTVFYPRIVERLETGDPLSEAKPDQIRPGQIRSHLSTRPEYLAMIRSAMRDDVLDEEGTGKSSRVTGYQVCGKTGTAEIKGNGLKDKVTWFASFAPYESPRYAVVVMVESGASGGGTCGPVARKVYEYLRDRMPGALRPVAMNP
jgi:penicillin-binding protein 2